MSQPLTTAGKLRLFLIRGLLAFALVALIWLGVIFWWQTTQRVVSMEDVLLYLVFVPVLALFGLLALFIIRSRKNRKAMTPEPDTDVDTKGSTYDDGKADYSLPVFAAWAVTSAGSNAQEFHATLKARCQRPQPDALLCDERGFPLMSARIPELDSAAIESRLSAAIDEPRDAFLRTAALLSQLLQQATNNWPIAPEQTSTRPSLQPQGTLRGNTGLATQEREAPLQLAIKLLAPSSFHPYEKEALQQHLQEELAHFLVSPDVVQFELLPATDDAAALRILDQFGMEARNAAQPRALLLLAAESTLCDSVTEEWQAAGRLFASHHPAGLMPGEAAFGLLCLNQVAALKALTEPLCDIGRVCSIQRPVSIDEGRKTDAGVLSEVIRQALAQSGIASTSIAAVACDADHRSSRTLECIGAMLEHTPQLDAVQDRLAVGEACGYMGAAAVTGSLVAGVMQVHESGQPVLLFNVAHLFERAAAVLLPPGQVPQTI